MVNLTSTSHVGTPTNPPTSDTNVQPSLVAAVGLQSGNLTLAGATTPSGSQSNFALMSKIAAEPGGGAGLVATEVSKKSYHHSNTAAADITTGRNSPPCIDIITITSRSGELLTVVSPGADIVEAMHCHEELPYLKNQPGLKTNPY